MKRALEATKINFQINKKSFVITSVLFSAVLIELLIYLFIFPSSTNGYLSMGNILLINILIVPIFTGAINFRKLIYLGMKKKEYFQGVLYFYLILASSLSIINILLYFIEKKIISNINLWYINILDVFNWFRYGIIGCFFYQLTAYIVLIWFIHLIALINDNARGWILDIFLLIIISVFISVGRLRNILAIFLNNILFNENLFFQIIFSGIATIILYSCSKLLLKRKKI